MSELAELRLENDQLREQIKYLEGLLKTNNSSWPDEWKLTAVEARLLSSLARGGLCTKEGLLNSVYYDRADDAPEIKIIDVFICKLRKKLALVDVTIATVWGQGYRLELDTLPAEVRKGLAA